MAGTYRVLVSYFETGSIPKDKMSNTLYYRFDGGEAPTSTQMDALFTFVLAAYRQAGQTVLDYKGYAFDLRLYDMADVEPRPLLHEQTSASTVAPLNTDREISLCLSYYAGRNLPRTRGRIYLGPINGSSVSLLASTTALNEVMAIGSALATANSDWTWVMHSEKDNDFLPITNFWCDNSWDVMRSRGIAATSRQNAVVT